MNKLEIGMYYRYKETFGKYIKPDLGQPYFTNQNKYGWHEIANYGKFSFNIIDIVQVGDYVNGKEIIYINFKDNEKIVKFATIEGCYYKNNDIKSIVTREQFEQMKYEVSNE